MTQQQQEQSHREKNTPGPHSLVSPAGVYRFVRPSNPATYTPDTPGERGVLSSLLLDVTQMSKWVWEMTCGAQAHEVAVQGSCCGA